MAFSRQEKKSHNIKYSWKVVSHFEGGVRKENQRQYQPDDFHYLQTPTQNRFPIQKNLRLQDWQESQRSHLRQSNQPYRQKNKWYGTARESKTILHFYTHSRSWGGNGGVMYSWRRTFWDNFRQFPSPSTGVKSWTLFHRLLKGLRPAIFICSETEKLSTHSTGLQESKFFFWKRWSRRD